jgi:hypothetical protein
MSEAGCIVFVVEGGRKRVRRTEFVVSERGTRGGRAHCDGTNRVWKLVWVGMPALARHGSTNSI